MKHFILTTLVSLVTIFPGGKDGTLKDITKPYLGEYECKSAQFGEKDCLEKFSYIRLELKEDGEFVLDYKEREGKKKQVEGKYSYDAEKGILKFTDQIGGFKREFPLNDGNLTIALPIAGRNLVLLFEQK